MAIGAALGFQVFVYLFVTMKAGQASMNTCISNHFMAREAEFIGPVFAKLMRLDTAEMAFDTGYTACAVFALIHLMAGNASISRVIFRRLVHHRVKFNILMTLCAGQLAMGRFSK